MSHCGPVLVPTGMGQGRTRPQWAVWPKETVAVARRVASAATASILVEALLPFTAPIMM